MAILAMCFDLMQEEIVAKFRWIGTKIGIIEKEDDRSIQADQLSNPQGKRNPSIALPTNDPNAIMNGKRSITDNEYDLPKQHSANSTRKASPRTNTARVHPIATTASNEATLYQRIAANKSN
jgi:hypothetical protein